MAIPKPGIYEGIEPEEYFSWEAVSNSRLSLLKRSPMHFQHGFTEPTEAMRLGTLVHTGVLEPLAIAQRYVFMPNYADHPENVTGTGERSFSSATKFVKSMQESFRKLHFDKDIVTKEQYDQMVGMATALAACPPAKELLRDGKAELSLVWEDRSGLLCKCRIDWLKPGIMADLKTCVDASEFERSIARYGYHRQMAFYQRGAQTLGIDNAHPWVVAVEKSAPYGVRCAPMAEEALVVGRKEIDDLLSQLIDCQKSKNWPGYESPDQWTLPAWYASSDSTEVVEKKAALSSWFSEATGGVH
jgi:hypothetical protein